MVYKARVYLAGRNHHTLKYVLTLSGYKPKHIKWYTDYLLGFQDNRGLRLDRHARAWNLVKRVVHTTEPLISDGQFHGRGGVHEKILDLFFLDFYIHKTVT